jgi:hypothetical protein
MSIRISASAPKVLLLPEEAGYERGEPKVRSVTPSFRYVTRALEVTDAIDSTKTTSSAT